MYYRPTAKGTVFNSNLLLPIKKEEIAGLLAALDQFISMDHEAEWATWRGWAETIAEAGSGIPGVRTEIQDGDPNRQGPTPVFYFEDGWDGPTSTEIHESLLAGDPSIQVAAGQHGEDLYVSPVALEPGEADIVAEALRSELQKIRMP